MNRSEILLANIDKLVRGTTSGKISWTKPSDTAYVWQSKDSKGNPTNIIVQLYRNNPKAILLRIFDVRNNSSLVDIKSDESEILLRSRLIELYDKINEIFKYGDLDILNDLLKDI